MKKYLFILRQAPYQGTRLQENLDIILTTAAFDQQVSLLLLDDAVFSLKEARQQTMNNFKDTSAIFKALEIYDVHHIYTETESLQERGLKSADLCLPIQEFYRKQINELILQYDIVFSL